MKIDQVKRLPENQVLIYTINSCLSDNQYVGSTVEPKRRWKNHLRLLKNGSHTSCALQNAWCKHGEKNFSFAPLIICAAKDRNFYETLFIEKIGTYNLAKKAGIPWPPGAMLGMKHTKQARENLSKGASRRWKNAWEKKYSPLCEKAWELVENGTPRYKACKAVGLCHDTFWKWLNIKGLTRGYKK